MIYILMVFVAWTVVSYHYVKHNLDNRRAEGLDPWYIGLLCWPTMLLTVLVGYILKHVGVSKW